MEGAWSDSLHRKSLHQAGSRWDCQVKCLLAVTHSWGPFGPIS